MLYMPLFLPGRQLNALFYTDVVGPLLAEHFPDLLYAAAFIGSGSDVLGFDTEMSTDHAWGPALLLFLRDQDIHLADDIRAVMRTHLPSIFRGYSVNYAQSEPEPGTGKTQAVLDLEQQQPVNHKIMPTTTRRFFREQ